MTPAAFAKYRRALDRELRAGRATEHTHRPALKTLIESLRPNTLATNEPKRVECGAPDYTVSREEGHGPLTIGYVEAKDVGVSLPGAARSEQLKRYRNALGNLILTDYLDFHWYVHGELRTTARLATLDDRGRLVLERGGAAAVGQLLSDFLEQTPEAISKPRELAERMARLTDLVRDVVVQAFETKTASDRLRDLHEAFAEVLIPDLSTDQFADMYAQTLAYGLFAARVEHDASGGRFRRLGAASEIPKTNPFLRQLFDAITGAALDDEPYAGLVDDLAQLLADADMEAVLADFGKRRQDPVFHFYETFLAAYNPTERELRGVYYTPEPVVSYIVRSVDHLLRTRFALADGLADASTAAYTTRGDDGEAREAETHRVLILDPACGTGKFLYWVVKLIRERFQEQGNRGQWPAYVREHLLPRLFGFELLMAPYAVAHLKLGMQLAAKDLPEEQRADWGYDFAGDERLGVYLTNSLEEALARSEVMFGRFISDEANAAAAIKRDLPIMVVIGNPPYSGHSANKGGWITDLVGDYKRGVPGLNKPAQAKWLQDDYVKFLRFGQWRIGQSGAGVLAFITNHSYLDNPTFRGMRAQLVETFTDIYVLDLHGNERKKERAPDGGPDKNVFDIQQGVAIGIFVKEPGKKGPAKVHHANLWGRRDEKEGWLSENDAESTSWKSIAPARPFYLFVPQDAALRAEYERGWRLPDAMNQNGDPAPGIVTTHDQFAISWTAEEAAAKVRQLVKTGSEDQARAIWRLCSTSQWSYEKAKKELANADLDAQIVPVLYRPFDDRWTVYNSQVAVHRRERVMRHMLAGANLGLLAPRQTKDAWDVFATRVLAGHKSASRFDITSLFPLYLYPSEHEVASGLYPSDERRPNLAPDFVADIERRLGLSFVPDGAGDLDETFGPEDVFHYIYAVLHSPSYRERYAEFLRIDFPRVPLISDLKLFREVARIGAELAALHLLESPELAQANKRVRYPESGSNGVAARHPRYVAPGDLEPHSGKALTEGRVYVSRDDAKGGSRGQYFEGVPPAVWEFQIGGYHVCERWLRDRRGRTLTFDDQEHYKRIVVAIAETIRLMEEVDAAIPGWPLA